MAVPARNVFDPVTVLDLDTEYDVLEDLVEGMADVERAIGIRGTIMKDEGLVF